MIPFEHRPHPHIAAREAAGPVKVADQHASGNAVTRFNSRLAVLVTRAVGSMWCAYAFAAFRTRRCQEFPVTTNRRMAVARPPSSLDSVRS